MTFHEKSAWIMGILLTLTGYWYFDNVWEMSQSLGETAPPQIALIAVATIMLIIGAVVSHIVISIIDPDSANEGSDERDKQVMQRSGNISGYVLGFGCFAALWHFYWQADGNLMFHIIVGSLIVSQVAEYVFTIIFYRRGA